MSTLPVAVLLLGCGRLEFDARIDAAIDAATVRCSWDSEPTFGPVVHHDEMSSPGYEVDPFVMPGDPLTIHFGSNRDGTFDVFTATRPAPGARFENITKRTDLSTQTTDETGFYLFADGSRGYYSFASPNGANPELYELSGSPGTLTRGRRLDELAAVGPIFYDPWPSSDDRELTFSSGPLNNARLYITTRSDPNVAWNPPTIFGVLDTSGATFTADRLTVVYALANRDLYFATRASTGDAFPPGQLISALDTTALTYEPSISEDGCELFFSRVQSGVDSEIYSVEVLP